MQIPGGGGPPPLDPRMPKPHVTFPHGSLIQVIALYKKYQNNVYITQLQTLHDTITNSSFDTRPRVESEAVRKNKFRRGSIIYKLIKEGRTRFIRKMFRSLKKSFQDLLNLISYLGFYK